jgi:hypothetical protein
MRHLPTAATNSRPNAHRTLCIVLMGSLDTESNIREPPAGGLHGLWRVFLA